MVCTLLKKNVSRDPDRDKKSGHKVQIDVFSIDRNLRVCIHFYITLSVSEHIMKCLILAAIVSSIFCLSIVDAYTVKARVINNHIPVLNRYDACYTLI